MINTQDRPTAMKAPGYADGPARPLGLAQRAVTGVLVGLKQADPSAQRRLLDA